jgi:hypothetical protein
MTWLDEIERQYRAELPGLTGIELAVHALMFVRDQTPRLLALARAAEAFADAAGVHWDGETSVLELSVEAQFWTALKEALKGE